MNIKSSLLKDEYPFNLVYDLITNKGGGFTKEDKTKYRNKIKEYEALDPTVFIDKALNTDISLVKEAKDSVLSYRENYMLYLRYNDKKTYDEIAEIHGISGCRVGQIIDRSLRKIRIYLHKKYAINLNVI